MFVRRRPSRTRAERAITCDRVLDKFARALVGEHCAGSRPGRSLSQPRGDCGGRRVRPLGILAGMAAETEILPRAAYLWLEPGSFLTAPIVEGLRGASFGRCGGIARLIFEGFKMDAFA